MVIRDSTRLIIGAISQKNRLPSSMVMVEALAASRAISFARETSILRVVVEGNSLQVIKAINSTKPSKTSYGHISMRLNCCLLLCLVVALFMLGARVIS